MNKGTTKHLLLLRKMKPGRVYRRSALVHLSTAADRYLAMLVAENEVVKISTGLYCRPKKSKFGPVPPDEVSLVKALLNGDRFLIVSFNSYTQLGIGLTQLYCHSVVYNRKRSGEFRSGGKVLVFRRMRKFPQQLSKEYLLVDMLNNIDKLAEDEASLLRNLKKNKEKFDAKKVFLFSKKYGQPRTRKTLDGVFGK